VLRAQEEERKRIAGELHDDTAQALSTLLIALDLLEPSLPPGGGALRPGVDRVRALARRTLDNVRALSHNLRPAILDDFGLVAALRWLADEYRQTFGMPVEIEIGRPAPVRLPPEMELALFRIAQEGLTNSAKYADAGRVRLALSFPDGAAELVVEDDGKGFDPGLVPGPSRAGGLGLFGMRERAELLNASLTIEAAPGRGTRIAVRAPLPQPASTVPIA
jgi:two-component system sensor histidine kinase UhpB